MTADAAFKRRQWSVAASSSKDRRNTAGSIVSAYTASPSIKNTSGDELITASQIGCGLS